jgi:hypothetical protein
MARIGRVARRTLVASGVVLLLLAVLLWILPVALDEPVTRTVETVNGSTKTTEQSAGWGSLRSESVIVAFLGGGVILLVLGVFPPGSVKRVRTPMGEIDFADAALADLAAAAAAKAPENVDGVFAGALNHLEKCATVSASAPFTPSPEQINEAVERAMQSDW